MEIGNYYTVLLYSKYSEFSKSIIKQIESSSFDFVNKKKLSTVCIDNDDIRNRILKSNDMDIKTVPCILIIHDDGVVEKYEGEDAFKWVEEIISKNVHVEQQPQIQQPQIQQPQIQQPQIQQPQIQQQVQPQIQPQLQPQIQQQIQPQLQQDIPRRMPPQREVPETRTQPVKKRVQETFEATPIEDISSGEEDLYDNIGNEDLFPPKQVSLRTGAGSYELNTDFGKKPETKVLRGIKSSTAEPTGRKGKTDVMSAALEMQKLREKEGEVIPKPTFA